MLHIDCRGARRRAGMTQEARTDAVGLSLDRVRSLEYRQGQFPGGMQRTAWHCSDSSSGWTARTARWRWRRWSWWCTPRPSTCR